ncbi:MAG: DUF2339 domain-containing protein, partial [Planctomycetota bacterium]
TTWRIEDGVVLAPVVFNLQFLVGAGVAVLLGGAVWTWGRNGEPVLSAADVRRAGLALIGVIGLWLGSLEIDRFCAPEAGHLEANAAMARQTALSIFWGIYALAVIVLGFAHRSAAARWAGLVLLVLTLGKVLTVDMAEVRRIYRVLSFLAVGILLVTTSVGYAKLAPKALASPDDAGKRN